MQAQDEKDVKLVIAKLLENKFVIWSVNDGGDENEPCSTAEEAFELIDGVDEAYLYVSRPSAALQGRSKMYSVHFVMGNEQEPGIVVCDYSNALSPYIGELWTEDYVGDAR